MANPSSNDRSFLDRRRAGTHVGRYLLPVLLALVFAGWVALFAWWPLAINPMHAAVYYEGQLVPRGTVTTYAITVTVLLNALMLMLSVAVVFALLSARRERRYLKLLAPQREPSSPLPPVPPDVVKDLETRT